MSLGLYLHWPWCKSKCPYCDFNSHVLDGVDQQPWRAGLLREMDRHHRASVTGPLTTIFFGGGTPSLMDPAVVAALIDGARSRWGLTDGAEITLEANPGDLDRGHLRALREAGVNRLSIGVQSFDDDALRFLGRRHDGAGAVRAAELARAEFDSLSLDLIYALPGQTPDQWRRQMDQALEFHPDHLSVYQLTIEKGTGFYRDGVAEAPEDLAEPLYDLTQDHLAAARLPAYEISNHGRPCQHNLEIWRGSDYLGIGPGAHGRLTRNRATHATYQWADPARWLAEAGGEAGADRVDTELSNRERLEELVLLGLRLTEGLDRNRFRALTGRDLERALDPAALDGLVADGLVILDERGLRGTPRGLKLLNRVAAALLEDAPD